MEEGVALAAQGVSKCVQSTLVNGIFTRLSTQKKKTLMLLRNDIGKLDF